MRKLTIITSKQGEQISPSKKAEKKSKKKLANMRKKTIIMSNRTGSGDKLEETKKMFTQDLIKATNLTRSECEDLLDDLYAIVRKREIPEIAYHNVFIAARRYGIEDRRLTAIIRIYNSVMNYFWRG